MMWLTTALGIIWLPTTTTTTWRFAPVSYDIQDLYFDRIVALTYSVDGSVLNYGIGVHISSDRILTSFNPFRTLIRNETMFSNLYASAMTRRIRRYERWFYDLAVSSLACGRQIQDLPDQVITNGDLWHGSGNRNCPLHDLLVFRIYNNLRVSTVEMKEYTLELFPANQITTFTTDLFLTQLAVPNERIGADFKFCAFVGWRLKVTYYTEGDHALLDCNEWLPRDWGYFFCIRNKNKYREVSSGAMLVSNEKLFGVASFVLSRGEESIIVFTDIRPYYDLIQNTCTYSDSEEKPPVSFPGKIRFTTTSSTTTPGTTTRKDTGTG